MIEILFATSNAGKAKEVQAMFSDLDVDVKTLREEGIDVAIEENGQTFAHIPQPIHSDLSILARPSFITIASEGQTFAQSP